ncbi:spore protease YyaC [Clostridium felsineum]|uniref:Uncharacterized protein n=1 Tax=Clostridium felsineum TaxID=36839 RepID=A0A1S8LY77_9CLOT|nr:spore protease YyaC [Clostridium felsineum]URZ08886.1 hypothetical protein CLROS_042810 [Clostridium felsineum]URZ09514.1 hypothetical protein CROST_001860 [Clostridium felsineum]
MEKKLVFNINDENILYKFSNYLTSELKPVSSYRDIIFLCIGTDRSTGDSLGPIIGYKLKKLHIDNLIVFGTLKEPVHAKNLSSTLDFINSNYTNPFIVAIDACLGNVRNIGNISIQSTPISPGAAMNKVLPSVGDLSIVGIVNISGPFDFMVLQSTRLYTVMNLADKISNGIAISMMNISQKYNTM